MYASITAAAAPAVCCSVVSPSVHCWSGHKYTPFVTDSFLSKAKSSGQDATHRRRAGSRGSGMYSRNFPVALKACQRMSTCDAPQSLMREPCRECTHAHVCWRVLLCGYALEQREVKTVGLGCKAPTQLSCAFRRTPMPTFRRRMEACKDVFQQSHARTRIIWAALFSTVLATHARR